MREHADFAPRIAPPLMSGLAMMNAAALGVAADDAEAAALVGVDHHRFRRAEAIWLLPERISALIFSALSRMWLVGFQPFVPHEVLLLGDPQRQAEQRARDVGDMDDVGGEGGEWTRSRER